ncbi:MAG: transposase, partial [Amphritea sp.]|nr:transposase [Amphritea sp.]
NHPGSYPWSSYGVNAEAKDSKLITPHDEYLALSKDDQSRRQAYRELFHLHIDNDVIKEIRRSTNGSFVLGSDRFKEEISMMLKRRVIPLKAGRPFKVD